LMLLHDSGPHPEFNKTPAGKMPFTVSHGPS
jgi:hypothetical protein